MMADTAWSVIKRSESLLDEEPFTAGPSIDKEEVKRHQNEFTSLESEIFAEWKTNARDALKSFMQEDAVSLVMHYCELAVAEVHLIYMNSKGKPGKAGFANLSVSYIAEILGNRTHFGDIIQVRLIDDYPNGPGDKIYVVDDLQKGSLLFLERSVRSEWDFVDIPIQITKDLFNPIQFYRICAPAQGYTQLDSVVLSFTHPYVQRLLQINPENRKDADYAFCKMLKCYFKNIMLFCSKGMPLSLISFSQNPEMLYVVDDDDVNYEIILPATYAKFMAQINNAE